MKYVHQMDMPDLGKKAGDPVSEKDSETINRWLKACFIAPDRSERKVETAVKKLDSEKAVK